MDTCVKKAREDSQVRGNSGFGRQKHDYLGIVSVLQPWMDVLKCQGCE